MRPLTRRHRRTAAGGAALLLAATLTAAPTQAQTTEPHFEVHNSGYGWSTIITHDWVPGTTVDITVADGDGTVVENSSHVVEPEGGFPAGGPGVETGWTVSLSDGTTTKTLQVPDLAIDRIDTSTREASGVSETPFTFEVEACQDSSSGPVCDRVPVVNDDGTAEWTSPPLPEVQDHYVNARWTDDDGDAFADQYSWPSVSYNRTATPLYAHHGLDLFDFPADSAVQVQIGPSDYDHAQTFFVQTDDGGFASVDLADPAALPIPIVDPTAVGGGMTFTATYIEPGWTVQKVLTGVDLTIDGIDHRAGTANGTCGAIPNFLSVNLVFGATHETPDQQEHEPPCVGGAWNIAWPPDPARVPLVHANSPEADNDGFGNQWPRMGLSLSEDGVNPLTLNFHGWDMDEPTNVMVTDQHGAPVFDGEVNGLVTGQPGEPGRWDLALDAVIDPALVEDGWVFEAVSTTQMKQIVRETVTVDLDGDGLVAINEHGEITGTVPPSDEGRQVLVNVDDAEHQVFSAPDGSWALAADFEGATGVLVRLTDHDGDGNWREAHFVPEGGESPLQIQAWTTADSVDGSGFTPGHTVHVILTDIGDGSTLFETDVDVWDEGDGNGRFWLDGREHGVDIRPGLRYTATENEDPTTTRTLDIVDARFDSFDPTTGVISGYAPDRPYETGEIRLHLMDQDGEPITTTGEPIKVVPTGDTWSFFVDPAIYGPVTALTEAAVEVPDAPEGGPDDDVSDATFAHLPFVNVLPERGEVHSDMMDDFETLTVEVFDSTGALVWDGTESVGEFGEVGVGGGPIAVGDEVVATATGGGGSFTITKTHVVEHLLVTDVIADPAAGTVDVFGEATAGAVVLVDVGNEFGGAGGEAVAESDETWHIQFTEEDGLVQVTEDMWYGAAVSDPDRDRTFVDRPEEPEPPAITADLVSEVVVAERWSDLDALVVEIDGVALTDFEVGENGEAIFPVDGGFTDGQLIVAGDGETTKEHVVVPLVITDVTGATVSGQADPDIWVGAFNDADGDFAFRGGMTDPVDGTFAFDFSVPPVEDGEGELSEIVLGYLGSFAPDDDGDGTFTFVTAPELAAWGIDEPIPTDTPVEVEVELFSAPPGSTALVHWGDGTTTDAVLNPDGWYRVAHTTSVHTYTDPGEYVIEVEAFEADGTVLAATSVGPFLVYPAVVDHNITFTDGGVIYPEQMVRGNVTIRGGTLVVHGVIESNVTDRGDGSVVIDGGLVTGSITERGDGDIEVIEGLVYGHLTERDAGSIHVEASVVNGNVTEKDAGDVTVTDGSVVDGKVCERGPGTLTISPDSIVNGSLAC